MPRISPEVWVGEGLLKHTIAFQTPEMRSYNEKGIFCVSEFYNDFENDPVVQISNAKNALRPHFKGESPETALAVRLSHEYHHLVLRKIGESGASKMYDSLRTNNGHIIDNLLAATLYEKSKFLSPLARVGNAVKSWIGLG